MLYRSSLYQNPVILFLSVEDDDDYVPREKRQRSPKSANDLGSSGRSTGIKFNFGKMKIQDDFVSLLCFMKSFWVIL